MDGLLASELNWHKDQLKNQLMQIKLNGGDSISKNNIFLVGFNLFKYLLFRVHNVIRHTRK